MTKIMAKSRIDIPSEEIKNFCHHWKIKELDLFGSVLRDDFRPDSDVDLLVTFEADAHWGFYDLVIMADELTEILGRKVDLVERRAVEGSENYIRRRHILQSLEPLYVAG